MSQENKAIFSRYLEEIWNKDNLTLVDELITTDFVQHTPSGDVKGYEAFKQYVTAFRTAFPDLHFTIVSSIDKGDKVDIYWSSTGTHKGEFLGIAVTGKHITLQGITVTRFAGKKLAENWLYWDRLSMLEQLGVAPK